MLAVCMAALPLGRCLWQPVRAADPPVDAGLLEFLGSVDSDDEDWHQYLGQSGGVPAPRPVHHDPADPPPPANNGAPAGSKPPGDSGDSPPPQRTAPSPSQADGSSGTHGPSSPPEVSQA